MYRHLFFPIVISAAMLCTLGGCDSGSPDDNNNPNPTGGLGTFSMTVTGAESASVTGTATSASSASTPGWGILFAVPSAEVSGFALSKVGGTRPGPGTYTVAGGSGASDDQYLAAMIINGTNYVSTSGTLTINESSDTEVKGGFNFNAASLFDPSSTVSVSGDFHSRQVNESGANR